MRAGVRAEEPGRSAVVGARRVLPHVVAGVLRGIESERGICWRCEDSLSLKRFLGFEPHESTPDHSTLSRMRTRLPESTYVEVFRFVMRAQRARSAAWPGGCGRCDLPSRRCVEDRRAEGQRRRATRATCAGSPGPASRTRPPPPPPRRGAAPLRPRPRRRRRRRMKVGASPHRLDAQIVRLKDGRTRLGYKGRARGRHGPGAPRPWT
ncbi:MAG: transposase [Sandaracinaceae bacterium]|nr:transposase [Sandaracinaceae bacterium]